VFACVKMMLFPGDPTPPETPPVVETQDPG
jgi:hypothetical protein